jgi:hypothetical protein
LGFRGIEFSILFLLPNHSRYVDQLRAAQRRRQTTLSRP